MDFRIAALIAQLVVLGLLSTADFLRRRAVGRSQKALEHQQLSLDFNPYTAGVDKQSIPSERMTL